MMRADMIRLDMYPMYIIYENVSPLIRVSDAGTQLAVSNTTSVNRDQKANALAAFACTGLSTR